jgi:trans-2,3-dihydro-3-hydroxyanthranilate isomerase
MKHRFVIADVFTDTPFGGNQLAVFPDGRGISDRAMQKLAREFNFSETTFVLPPEGEDGRRPLRIFTPATELPFAGHPTVGTAAVLVRLGIVPATAGAATVRFSEPVGPVDVEVKDDGQRLFARLRLEQPVTVYPEHPRAEAAAALSLSADEVLDAWFASVGNPFCFVHLRDRAAVDRAVLDRGAWGPAFAEAVSPNLYFFSGELAPGGALYARLYAPEFGIEEDPATGSAAATLAGYLAERTNQPEGTFAWRIEQGVKMGRPSVLEASAEKRGGRTVAVMAGGGTVLVAEGMIEVPEDL